MSVTERIQARIRSSNPTLIDVLFAGLMMVGVVIGMFSQNKLPGERDPNALAVAIAIVGVTPIALRRRYPLGALAASLPVYWLYFELNFPQGTLPLVFYMLMYSVAVWASPNHSALGLALGSFALVLFSLLGLADLDFPYVLQTLILTLLAWIAGQVIRWLRETSASDVREAQQQIEVEQQRSARALAEERLRIAQELHDVLAHSMSVVAVQAGMGAHLLDDDPEQAKAALAAISDISRSTLTEMRRLLGVLRDDEGASVHTPAPAIADLPSLVDDVRAAGLPVDLSINGDPPIRNPGVELSAYRVVQEALTNVIKHAGATKLVTVSVRYLPSELAIEVNDDGRGLASPRHRTADGNDEWGGHGLVGMKERVDVWGGNLSIGPRPGGGYRVRANLPYGDEAR